MEFPNYPITNNLPGDMHNFQTLSEFLVSLEAVQEFFDVKLSAAVGVQALAETNKLLLC